MIEFIMKSEFGDVTYDNASSDLPIDIIVPSVPTMFGFKITIDDLMVYCNLSLYDFKTDGIFAKYKDHIVRFCASGKQEAEKIGEDNKVFTYTRYVFSLQIDGHPFILKDGEKMIIKYKIDEKFPIAEFVNITDEQISERIKEIAENKFKS